MVSRMMWNKAKKAHQPVDTRHQRELERQAHMILNGSPKKQPSAPETAHVEHMFYRSVGSVIWRDGQWLALGVDGIVLGAHKTRWEAWQQANKLGMERIAELV